MSLCDTYLDKVNRSARMNRDGREEQARKREMNAHKWKMHTGVR